MTNEMHALYNNTIEEAKKKGKSDHEAEIMAKTKLNKNPKTTALNSWLDVYSEIKAKNAIEELMKKKGIQGSVIRGMDLKELKALGINLPHPD